MASYFYLMSSLPMLKANNEMPISYSDFLNYCKGNVTEEKYAILSNLSIDSCEGPLVAEWSKFYGIFKKELTYQRYKKLGKNIPIDFNQDSEIAKVITTAINEKNPLNAEMILLELQFKIIDSLIGTHTFDDYALLGYALKLKLISRNAIFDQKRGNDELIRLTKVIEEQIKTIE